MCNAFRQALLTIVVTAAVPIVLGAYDPQQHQHPPTHPASGAHQHPQAAKLKNPVAADAMSIAAGEKLYAAQCAGCHGETGTGDGSMGADLNPRPSNLADADWKHGATDGEMFTVIRDGVKNTGMKSARAKLTTHQLWDVVNYVRSLGPKHP
jgi:mono/diheme cytochrome c family protein